jgi:hypothetical protein
MKPILAALVLTCFILALVAPAFGGDPMPLKPGKAVIKPKVHKATPRKMTVSNAFKVKQVRFERIVINNQEHLAVAVIFNKNIDAATVMTNSNIRLLKQNASNFWVDASTQNNTVNIRPNFITWVCGAPLEAGGLYKMHLRGTIKSTDGVSLDCNGDGKGEGGQWPPYESQTYRAPGILQLDEIIDR